MFSYNIIDVKEIIPHPGSHRNVLLDSPRRVNDFVTTFVRIFRNFVYELRVRIPSRVHWRRHFLEVYPLIRSLVVRSYVM